MKPTKPSTISALLEATGKTDNERVQEMAGRALVRRAVQAQLIDHVYHSVLDGSLPPAGGSIIRVTHAETIQYEIDTALAIAESGGVIDDSRGLAKFGDRYLSRQTASLGGGTTEIARNIIGERILGFPPGVRRRSRRAVQSGKARQELRPSSPRLRTDRESESRSVRSLDSHGLLEEGRLQDGGGCCRRSGCERPTVAAQAVFGHQRRHPVAQHVAVARR